MKQKQNQQKNIKIIPPISKKSPIEAQKHSVSDSSSSESESSDSDDDKTYQNKKIVTEAVDASSESESDSSSEEGLLIIYL